MRSIDVAQLKAPVIVFIQPLGYKHFAVIRGIDGGAYTWPTRRAATSG